MDILLIHGALGASSQLQPLQSLLGGERSVHLVELEGHGSTPMATSAYSIARFADNVRDFIAARRLERVAIFGYSMGGYVALSLAAESPELVSAVATVGTKLAWTPEVAAREVGRMDPAKIRAKVPAFAEELARRHGAEWEAVLARTAALMTALGTKPVVDAALLGRITQPVRLMVGDRDALVSVEETAAAAKAIGAGELAVLPNTVHPIEHVRMPMVAKLLHDFAGGRSETMT